MDFGERPLILLDVFKDVECPNNVELVLERDSTGVHLEELRVGNPLRSDLKARLVQLTADEPHLGKSPSNARQDEASAAADLKHAPSIGKERLQRPEDELVPGAEPEALLNVGEVTERLLVEAA